MKLNMHMHFQSTGCADLNRTVVLCRAIYNSFVHEALYKKQFVCIHQTVESTMLAVAAWSGVLTLTNSLSHP